MLLGVDMTCYFRHLHEVFRKAGIEVTPQNRKQLDMALHELINVEYKNCSSVWKEVKRYLIEDEEGLIRNLKKTLAKKNL